MTRPNPEGYDDGPPFTRWDCEHHGSIELALTRWPREVTLQCGCWCHRQERQYLLYGPKKKTRGKKKP